MASPLDRRTNLAENRLNPMELLWNSYGIRMVHQAHLARAACQQHALNSLLWLPQIRPYRTGQGGRPLHILETHPFILAAAWAEEISGRWFVAINPIAPDVSDSIIDPKREKGLLGGGQ